MKYMVLYFCQIFGLFLSNPLSGLTWPFVLPFPWHYVSWCVLNSHQSGQEVWCGPDLTRVGCKQFPESWDFAYTMGINLSWHTSAAPQQCKNFNSLFGFFMTSCLFYPVWVFGGSLFLSFSLYPWFLEKLFFFFFPPPPFSGKWKKCLLWSWTFRKTRKYIEAVDKTMRAGKGGTSLLPSKNICFFF